MKKVGNIRDYPCRLGAAAEYPPQLCEQAGVEFPRAHGDAAQMAALALAKQQADGASFCLLPFCHTVEAEAMGARINLGDAVLGPRSDGFVCESVDDLLHLPNLDLCCPRIAAVLDACQILVDQNAFPVFQVSGPLTVLNSLIDSSVVLRALRKQPDEMRQVLELLRSRLLAFVRAAYQRGVRAISYSDPMGGVDIVGPRTLLRLTEEFSVPFLQSIETGFGGEMLVVLCPKTAFALVDLGFAKESVFSLPSKMTYGQAIAHLPGKARLVGSGCVKEAAACDIGQQICVLELCPSGCEATEG